MILDYRVHDTAQITHFDTMSSSSNKSRGTPRRFRHRDLVDKTAKAHKNFKLSRCANLCALVLGQRIRLDGKGNVRKVQPSVTMGGKAAISALADALTREVVSRALIITQYERRATVNLKDLVYVLGEGFAHKIYIPTDQP